MKGKFEPRLKRKNILRTGFFCLRSSAYEAFHTNNIKKKKKRKSLSGARFAKHIKHSSHENT
jgi:hypothetical protein